MIQQEEKEILKIVCALCKVEVKKHVVCLKCEKSYHPNCALKTIGLFVNEQGIICCEGIRGRKSKLSPSSALNSADISPLEVELLKKLLKEREDNNILLKENKKLLEVEIEHLNKEVKRLNEVNNQNVDSQSYSNIVKKKVYLPPLVIKPKMKQDGSLTKKDIKEKIQPDELMIGINKLNELKNGNVCINCEDIDSREKIKHKVIEEMSEKYVVEDANLNVLALIIKRVEKDLIDSSDNTIKSVLIKQNNLGTGLEKIRILKKYIVKGKDFGNIVIGVDSEIYSKIIDSNKIKLGWTSCFVTEYINVIRCYNCARYGHIASKCRKNLTCGKCSEGHKTAECQSEYKKCINCVDAKDKLGINIDENHTVYDKNCKCFKKIYDSLKRRNNQTFL